MSPSVCSAKSRDSKKKGKKIFNIKKATKKLKKKTQTASLCGVVLLCSVFVCMADGYGRMILNKLSCLKARFRDAQIRFFSCCY